MNYFNSLIKPASSLCNMSCDYCFYSDVAHHREIQSYGIMSISTAKTFIDKVFEYIKEKQTTISFAFQGGEPTLAGLGFYNEFVDYVQIKKPKNAYISYSIQTNGFGIDENWCDFFYKHHFLVGVSLDAYKDIHDLYRKDKNNKGTFQRVLKSIRLLAKFKVDYNILSVISRELARHPVAVFNSYRKNNIEFVQLIPCLNSLDGIFNPKTDLTPHMYAEFMKEMFNLWELNLKNGHILHIREFENIVSRFRGNKTEQCGLSGYCTAQFVLESDGCIYPCDFYVIDQYRTGSILENSIEEIEKSDGINKFLKDKQPLHPLCADCKVFSHCGGGCKRYRSFYRIDETYCPYQDFLYCTADRFLEIARNME